MSISKRPRPGESQLVRKSYTQTAPSTNKKPRRNPKKAHSSKRLSMQSLEQRLALSGNDVVDAQARYEFENDLSSTTGSASALVVVGQTDYSNSRMGLGQALEVDGNSGAVDVSASAASVSDEFTVSLWVQVPQRGGKDSLVAINDDQGQALMVLYLDTDRSLKVKVGQNSALTNVAEKLGDNQWHHISIVRDTPLNIHSSTAKIFLDGEQVRTFNLGGKDFSNATWTVGAENTGTRIYRCS